MIGVEKWKLVIVPLLVLELELYMVSQHSDLWVICCTIGVWSCWRLCWLEVRGNGKKVLFVDLDLFGEALICVDSLWHILPKMKKHMVCVWELWGRKKTSVQIIFDFDHSVFVQYNTCPQMSSVYHVNQSFHNWKVIALSYHKRLI